MGVSDKGGTLLATFSLSCKWHEVEVLMMHHKSEVKGKDLDVTTPLCMQRLVLLHMVGVVMLYMYGIQDLGSVRNHALILVVIL
ncbi:hypothetical protein CBR_g30768 [Chara braunii]|uniref:Uncharacterized protein n=1 Tax=Chara braunii TaxID=69332 RepID=A0A388JXE8_CHABU|nr:hypothetical protein CBR_g30768 [Chara braunii]|eukprot:GBG62448.1 hypothetical protein CBR_g30768 [Chara braunii]